MSASAKESGSRKGVWFAAIAAGAFLGFLSVAPARETNGRTSAVLYIDRMEPLRGHDTGSLASPLWAAPSRLVAVREPCGYEENGGIAFGLRLSAQLVPDAVTPEIQSGWCAYGISVKKQDEYLDAGAFEYLTFYVRGEVGDEKLSVALMSREHGDDVTGTAGIPVHLYLKDGVISREWQKAWMPLTAFQADLSALHRILFIFDNRLYESASARRIMIYVDELAME